MDSSTIDRCIEQGIFKGPRGGSTGSHWIVQIIAYTQNHHLKTRLQVAIMFLSGQQEEVFSVFRPHCFLT